MDLDVVGLVSDPSVGEKLAGPVMVIAARGAPMDDAMTGEVIKVRNLDTGVMVNGTVMADGSVEVVQK